MSDAKSDQKPTSEKSAVDAKLSGLEKWAYDTFNTNNPVKIPEAGRKWIAENVWWLAAIGGVLTLIGAYQMWRAAHVLSSLDSLYRAVGYVGYTPGIWWYIMFGITLLEGIVLLVAISKLKTMQKSGWKLLFYLSLVSVALGIISLLTPGYGVGSLIGVAIGIAISWTILMQIRDRFTK